MTTLQDKVIRRLLLGVSLVGILAASTGGGCDWFNDPIEANLLPDTTMEACPGGSRDEVVAGDNVTIEWSGTDIDGTVVSYLWAYDDTVSEITFDTSLVIEDVGTGSHVFEVAAIDDDGDEDPTPATCEFTASEPGGLVPRAVLAEFFSGLGCPNCPNARDGLRVMLREFGRDSLCVLAYFDGPHPLSTDESDDRLEWYMGSDVTPPLPTVAFDGDWVDRVTGAQDSTSAASEYREEIEARRLIGSPVTVELDGDVASGDVTATVRVRDPIAGGSNVLRIAVIEDRVLFHSEYEMFVVRDILEEEALIVAAVGDSAVVERSFTIDGGWNTDNMDVIAFVQNDATKEILQSGRLDNR